MQIDPEIKFWSEEQGKLLARMSVSANGLTSAEAASRKSAGKKQLPQFLQQTIGFFLQFKNPLALLLVFSLTLSAYLGEYKESAIIFSILFLSGILSYVQEYRATQASEKLRKLIGSKARVRRDDREIEVPLETVVPGDILILEAGDIVPADGRILESKDLYVNESVLTGESFPSEKKVRTISENSSLIERTNCVFKGTSVISGSALVLAIFPGAGSEVGKIEKDIVSMQKVTAFEIGIRNFGYMLMRVAFMIAGFILIMNIYLGKNPLDSILFALALSLGLTPEMLPAIVTITLSAGAKRLAARKVIVKRLNSVQNLGAINVLCSDKTGTLTEGLVKIHSVLSPGGNKNDVLKLYAYLNALYQSGYPNPMDNAIREQLVCDTKGYAKYDEVPFDFVRKRLSIVVAFENKHLMITKGAFKNVLEVCNRVRLDNGETESITNHSDQLLTQYEAFGNKGLRTIGVAIKDVTGDPLINKDDEAEMIFLGFVLLFDPPKQGIVEALTELERKQVKLKIITGDNTRVAKSLAEQLGIPATKIISGSELHAMHDDVIVRKVDDFTIFSETEPSQKERIVRALQKRGNVVGYLGDGINDAAALKAADVGISVENAVDIAKESADMILLEKGLKVISDGISEGRKTYLNTLKYVFITVSANFGNMISMAIASVALPFFPMLASQILLTNLLTDIPALAISSDKVDDELLLKPRKWNQQIIRRFMFLFGIQSSLFDLLTFFVLLHFFHTTPDEFRTGWFMESVVTEIVILLVIRSHRRIYKSSPARLLLVISVLVTVVTFLLPYFPFAEQVNLVPLHTNILFSLIAIALTYGVFSEVTKAIFFRKIRF